MVGQKREGEEEPKRGEAIAVWAVAALGSVLMNVALVWLAFKLVQWVASGW